MARCRRIGTLPVLAALWVLVPALGLAQTPGMWGRISFTAVGSTAKDSGVERGFTELITTITLATPVAETGGAEFGMDFRGAAYPGTEDRERRLSIYEGFVGYRLAGGRLGARVGQLWLNDLGALGSVGGVHVEYRQPMGPRKTRVRAGAFGGMEPKIMDAGYVSDVRKFGGYVALDGAGARRHVLGFVALRNQGLHERSVLTFSNFVPAGRSFFLYQAGEYDLEGPAGQGSGGLSYFFANARYSGIKLARTAGQLPPRPLARRADDYPRSAERPANHAAGPCRPGVRKRGRADLGQPRPLLPGLRGILPGSQQPRRRADGPDDGGVLQLEPVRHRLRPERL